MIPFASKKQFALNDLTQPTDSSIQTLQIGRGDLAATLSCSSGVSPPSDTQTSGAGPNEYFPTSSTLWLFALAGKDPLTILYYTNVKLSRINLK